MTFAEIDEERKKQGLTILELSRRAGVAPSTYWFIQHAKTRPRRSTLEKLGQALNLPRPPADPYAAVRSTYRAHLAYVAREMGFDPVAVADRPAAREFWRARAVALASVAADLDLRHAEIGRALGLSKQIVNWNIKQALNMPEARRLAWFAEKSGRLGQQAAS